MSSTPNLRRGGFTLIELLVVISIISLLVAILLPSLARARVAAQRLRCLSQVRGHGYAAAMYASDNRNTFPDSKSNNGYGVIDTAVVDGWTDTYNSDFDKGFYALSGYYQTNYEAWFCPSNNITAWADRKAGNTWGSTPPGVNHARGGYMYRYVNDHKNQPGTNSTGLEVALRDEGQTFPAGDTYLGYSSGQNIGPSKTAIAGDLIVYYRSNTVPVTPSIAKDVHIDGFNAVFYDGHGEFRSKDPFDDFTSGGTFTTDIRNMYRGFIYILDLRD